MRVREKSVPFLFFVDESTAVFALDDVSARKPFLKGERDENDRRVVHLRLCGEGIEVAERLKQTSVRVAQKLRENVTDEELQTAHRIMCKMQRNLDTLYDSMEGMVK